MTCTKAQIRKFMRYRKIHSLEIAAAKAGMSENTARRYANHGGKPLPKQDREYRTRKDPFAEVWNELEQMLSNDDGLEAKTLLEWLIEAYPGQFHSRLLRTLQRRVSEWRALHGPAKDIFFPQMILPGRQSQSDYTWCNELGITIAGKPFEHMLFHFMLPYSRWETVSIAFTESFESLTEGYAAAVKELSAVAPDHRTDNLAAAVPIGERKIFQKRWKEFLGHFGVQPSSNTPKQSHENGSVEKSNDLLKRALDQRLRLRGSREFPTRTAYEEFVRAVIYRRNKDRKQRLNEELKLLKELPRRDWNAPQELFVSVQPWSTVSILRSIYSVPSRLVGAKLRALVYSKQVELYFGKNLVQRMPRVRPGEAAINYRHVVAQLVRKPGAFRNYRFRDELFPTTTFRKLFDRLEQAGKDEREYLKILNLAAMDGENIVETAVQLLLEMQVAPTLDAVKDLINTKREVPNVQVILPSLSIYDRLLSTADVGVIS